MNKPKTICSCIRNKKDFKEINWTKLCDKNESPKPGDVLLAKVVNEDGYEYLEDWNGRNVKLYKGDFIVVVLGNRFSGTNTYGKIPEQPLGKWDLIDLLAQGGIVGKSICAGLYENAKKMCIVGFCTESDGSIYNINNHMIQLEKLDKHSKEKTQLVFVFGTSAETGKTTLTSKLINGLKNQKKLVAATKLCGTGRLKDKLSYLDAGADISLDFVDMGIATTYGEDEKKIRKIFEEVYNYCNAAVDYLVVEIGGDALEANANVGVSIANEYDCLKMVCVNDAMGGLMYKSIFKNAIFFSYKQNIVALKARLDVEKVYQINEDAIRMVVDELIEEK